MLKITIHRQGQFVVNWDGSNANQCGVKGTQVLYYNVAIVGDENHLNAQGFIIDNNDIHAYFRDTYHAVRDFESCEHIAIRACRDLQSKFGHGTLEGVKIHSVKVMVSGSPTEAGLTAEWTAPAMQM